MGCQLRALSETDRTLVRTHPQEDSIPNLILSINSLRINILLLSILCLSQALSDQGNLLLHLLNQLRTNRYSIPDPVPTQRCPARSPIQGLIRWHTYGCVVPIVIGKLDKV